MAPDFGPFGLAVAALGFAILIGRGRVVVLLEENFGSTGMRNKSRSCLLSPVTRKPLPFASRRTVYLLLNSGAPVESSHWAKNQLSWPPEFCSAIFFRSSVAAGLPA